jgi:sugar phosphate isomerase/epimerase
MIRPAFSTVACPHWTLRDVAARSDEYGFECVELRTFGDDSRLFACDPALSAPAKTRELFRSRGIEIACLATSLSYDAIIGPPVLGPALWDQERAIRETRRAIDLAVALDCPFVRVFGFKVTGQDTRKACVGRIAERLRLALDHANKTGVRLVIENAGSFPTSSDLLEIIRACDHPLLGACYANSAAALAGEDPARGVATLGDRLWVARIEDAAPLTNGGPGANSNKGEAKVVVDDQAGERLVPCELGAGRLGARAFVAALRGAAFKGPLVYEHDFAWLSGLTPPEQALPIAARTLYAWASGGEQASTGAGMSGSSTNSPGSRTPARAGR